MNDSRLADYLDQMRTGVKDALSYIEGQSERDFLADGKTRRAVILCLLLIGEASAKVMDRYPDFASEHGDIPWRAIRGMRNRIAHRYFEIDLGIVWETLQNELPSLAASLQRLA